MTSGLAGRASGLLAVAALGGAGTVAVSEPENGTSPVVRGTTTAAAAAVETASLPAAPATTRTTPPARESRPTPTGASGTPKATTVVPAGTAPSPAATRPTPPARRDPTVPNVVGQTVERARALLRGAGFEVSVAGAAAERSNRNGRVVAQSPAPGTPAPALTRVVLIVEPRVQPTPAPTTTG